MAAVYPYRAKKGTAAEALPGPPPLVSMVGFPWPQREAQERPVSFAPAITTAARFGRNPVQLGSRKMGAAVDRPRPGVGPGARPGRRNVRAAEAVEPSRRWSAGPVRAEEA